VRVFRLKLLLLLHDLTKKHVLGRVNAVIWVVEFQKRGLPHAHICVMLAPGNRPRTTEDIDKLVSARFPDKQRDPVLHGLVLKHMVHAYGSCNASSPCWKDGVCGKMFPKDQTDVTHQTDDGYPRYARPRNDEVGVYPNGQVVTNQYVVPYNPYLLKQYQCHINVEVTTSFKVVKYLFKYVYKGSDTALVEVYGNDETVQYLDSRYLSATESMWRFMSFALHDQTPTVFPLTIDLNPQHKSHLHAYLQYNTNHPEDQLAHSLTYDRFVEHYRYITTTGVFQPRIKNIQMIGRVYFINPAAGELYYLRLLLLHVPGVSSLVGLRFHNGRQWSTYRETAVSYGLAYNDEEYVRCLTEASQDQLAPSLRRLFVTIVSQCQPQNAQQLFTLFADEMAADLLGGSVYLAFSMILGLLSDLGISGVMAKLDIDQVVDDRLENSIGVTTDALTSVNLDPDDVADDMDRFSDEQRGVFDRIRDDLINTHNQHHLYFVEGPGGTGKTFLFQTMLAWCETNNVNAMVFSSTGITATMYRGGLTVHKGLGVPINVTNSSICSLRAVDRQRIRECKLMIIDEATMLSKLVYLCIDRTLRSIMDSDQPFGGKLIVFGGHWAQILPVVRHGNMATIVAATMKRCGFWHNITQLRLSINLRLRNADEQWRQLLHRAEFGDDSNTLELPAAIVLTYRHDCREKFRELIDFVFPDLSVDEVVMNHRIITPLNKDVDEINQMVMERYAGVAVTCPSVSSIDNDSINTPIEFLNSLTVSGLPPHLLTLKVGVPVMLLRNINVGVGLCNGTIMIVEKINTHALVVRIAGGAFANTVHILPRITLSSNEMDAPFILKRLQFPVNLAFAMTINKAQGQTIDRVGLYLPTPVFTHGQMYVALSRVRNQDSIRVVLPQPNTTITSNVVYRCLYQMNPVVQDPPLRSARRPHESDDDDDDDEQ
jgi:hypothetical protein